MNRNDMYGFIAGTLLGDSWLQKVGNSYSIGSQNTILSLIQLKKQVFDSFNHRDNKIGIRPPRYSKIAPNSSESYVVWCTSSKLKYFYNVMYVENKKRMTRRILDRLTPFGLAVWYMDDGYYIYTDTNNTRRMYLCTDSFSENEIHTAIKYFQEVWDIRATIKWHKGNKDREAKPRLKFGGKDIQKFVSIVYPYILPDFWYKINVVYQYETRRLIPEFIPIHRELIARNIRKNEDIVQWA